MCIFKRKTCNHQPWCLTFNYELQIGLGDYVPGSGERDGESHHAKLYINYSYLLCECNLFYKTEQNMHWMGWYVTFWLNLCFFSLLSFMWAQFVSLQQNMHWEGYYITFWRLTKSLCFSGYGRRCHELQLIKGGHSTCDADDSNHKLKPWSRLRLLSSIFSIINIMFSVFRRRF